MSVEVLCIGHAAYDLSAFVEHFPTENGKTETSALQESGGGPAANAAYLLSLWGMRSGFAGLIGDDHYGHCIRKEFEEVGTDLSWLEMRRDHPTPVSLIIINKQNGSRTIVNRKAPGAAFDLPPTALIRPGPRVLLFDGHELEASLAALKAFPRATSILDAGSWRPGTAELAGRVNYLAASERFALHASGLPSLRDEASQRECLLRLRERFKTTVIVTLGEHGLIADHGHGMRYLPAYPAQAVDTTGAGDIFHGALAFGVAIKLPLWEALQLAAMTASLSVRIAGGRGSIPSLAQVKEALAHAG